MFELTLTQLIILAVYSFSMGVERAGIRSINMVTIPTVFASLGPMAALGYTQPVVVISNFFSVARYWHVVDWHIIARTWWGIPAGILAGFAIGSNISTHTFKIAVGIILIVSLSFAFINDIQKRKLSSPALSAVLGLLFAALTGLSSTLGAAGGPVILSYMLLLNLPKEKLIGTSAFFCFLVDIMKLPLYILIWHNITAVTFLTSLIMTPAIILGFIIGLRFVKKFSNRGYRLFILAISFVSAIRLFF